MAKQDDGEGEKSQARAGGGATKTDERAAQLERRSAIPVAERASCERRASTRLPYFSLVVCRACAESYRKFVGMSPLKQLSQSFRLPAIQGAAAYAATTSRWPYQTATLI